MDQPDIQLLRQFARQLGVQTAYYDARHQRQEASAEALLAALRALGAPVAAFPDVPSAWREHQQGVWRQMLEPVAVAWNGGPLLITIRLPQNAAGAILSCHLELETGEQQSWTRPGADTPTLEAADVEGTRYVAKQLSLPGGLPWGYHRLTVEVSGRHGGCLVISAPVKAYLPEELEVRDWGIFLPLYALHTEGSWGGGDFSDFASYVNWAAAIGAQFVATLPLLPTLFTEPFDPSPYLPISRLLWNEFYLDIASIPELERCPAAQDFLTSSHGEIQKLRNLPLVDYGRQMVLKRRVLERLCRCLFAGPSERLKALHHFAGENPLADDYARFRATVEKQGVSWPSWPQRLRDGVVKTDDYDEESRRYHLYAQWLAHQQFESVSEQVKRKGLKLYLDVPLGVRRDGYDVWREQSSFATDALAGAPPDTVFTRGQNWEFPPLHPERIREQGYRYVIAYLRHHLRHAAILRIDHVMGLHRLFWIPVGLDASQGVYVHYRAEELYAILAVESHRSKTIIVGEDLGTVPPEVRPAMARHGLHRTYVMQYEVITDGRPVLQSVPTNSVTSLNTHDMPPFASFWQGMDIKERLELGLLTKESAEAEVRDRQAVRETLSTFLRDKGCLKGDTPDIDNVLTGCLSFLSASPARFALVNLEDLWRETRPHNIPSTKKEYPNWRRKAYYSLESFRQIPLVLDKLRVIEYLRKQGRC